MIQKKVVTLEDVRVCRFCGHIDPVDSRGRCRKCGLFLGLDIVSRVEAEQLARRHRLRFWRSRLFRLFLVCVLLSGVTIWALRVFFDLGLNPPGATTDISARVEAGTWAQYRRTPENSGFTPDSAPFPHHVAWTYRTAEPLLSSPAIVKNRVYLTTGDGRTIALDRHTGQRVWEYANGGPSGSTPAVAEELVIFVTRPGLVAALDRHAGALRWQTNLKHAILASPIVVDGTVYIGDANNRVYALDAATGRQRWVFTAMDWIVSAVAYAGDRIIVTSQSSLLYGIGSKTGRQRLIYDTGLGRHITTSPVIRGNWAYFGSFGGRVWAIDWQTTVYPFERAMLFWKTNFYLWGMLSKPPIQKGTVWNRRVGGDVMHTPATAHDMVYATTSQEKVVALDAVTGVKRWSVALDVEATAAPIVAGTALLIGTRKGVVALDAHSGQRLWNFQAGGAITGSPVVVGDTMYVVSDDGTLYACRGDNPANKKP